MNTKILYFILSTLLTYGCNTSTKPFAVFDYEDFGPQVMAWEKIGMQWWQWDNHGGSDPKDNCDIKVVVYADLPLDEIKLLFPTNRKRKMDFRYFDYYDSLKYLNKNIRALKSENEQWAIDLKERLIHTKERILQEIITENKPQCSQVGKGHATDNADRSSQAT